MIFVAPWYLVLVAVRLTLLMEDAACVLDNWTSNRGGQSEEGIPYHDPVQLLSEKNLLAEVGCTLINQLLY